MSFTEWKKKFMIVNNMIVLSHLCGLCQVPVLIASLWEKNSLDSNGPQAAGLSNENQKLLLMSISYLLFKGPI